MSTYKIVDQAVGAPSPVTQVDATQRFPLGFIARAADNSLGAAQFVYLQGSNVASVGQLVAISGNQAVLAGTVNSTAAGPVAVAAGVMSATNLYGWAQVQGICDFVKFTNSSVAAGAPVYMAAGTAGVVVTNVVAGNGIKGIVPTVSYTSSQTYGTAHLMYPQVIGLTASI